MPGQAASFHPNDSSVIFRIRDNSSEIVSLHPLAPLDRAITTQSRRVAMRLASSGLGTGHLGSLSIASNTTKA